MDERTILITGATGNIGGGAAMALAKRGARLVLLGRRIESLERRAEAIRGAIREEGGPQSGSIASWLTSPTWTRLDSPRRRR